jgi:DNA-binding transcriptional LysR family regulator
MWCAAPHLERGVLRRVLPLWQPPASRIYAIYASVRYVPQRVRLFMDFLAEELRLPA